MPGGKQPSTAASEADARRALVSALALEHHRRTIDPAKLKALRLQNFALEPWTKYKVDVLTGHLVPFPKQLRRPYFLCLGNQVDPQDMPPELADPNFMSISSSAPYNRSNVRGSSPEAGRCAHGGAPSFSSRHSGPRGGLSFRDLAKPLAEIYLEKIGHSTFPPKARRKTAAFPLVGLGAKRSIAADSVTIRDATPEEGEESGRQRADLDQ